MKADKAATPTVRAAGMADAPALARLIRGLGYFERFESEDLAATAGRVGEHLAMCLADDSHLVLVAEVEGMVGTLGRGARIGRLPSPRSDAIG